jgi:hypothetical protein
MKKLGRNCSVVVYNKIKKERSEKVKKKHVIRCAKRNYLGSLGFSGQGLI